MVNAFVLTQRVHQTMKKRKFSNFNCSALFFLPGFNLNEEPVVSQMLNGFMVGTTFYANLDDSFKKRRRTVIQNIQDPLIYSISDVVVFCFRVGITFIDDFQFLLL